MALETLRALAASGSDRKLKILVETSLGKFDTTITVLFNPNQVTLRKTANWRPVQTTGTDSAAAQFTQGEPVSLTMDLFFDTFEEGTNVCDHTNRIFHLATVEKNGDLHRPPLCKLQWGKFTFGDLQWVLQSVDQRFTLFFADGSPARATLGCTFKQWRSRGDEAKTLKTSSPNVAKSRTLRRGETLSGIAAEEYNDPGLWRPIADANGIDNPRLVTPGTSLAIPPLSAGGLPVRGGPRS